MPPNKEHIIPLMAPIVKLTGMKRARSAKGFKSDSDPDIVFLKKKVSAVKTGKKSQTRQVRGTVAY